MVHLTVHKFTPSSLKRMKALWSAKRHELPPFVFAQGIVDDDKFERFVSHFGFKPITFCICTDGVNRRIFAQFHRSLDGPATAEQQLVEPAVERAGTLPH